MGELPLDIWTGIRELLRLRLLAWELAELL